MFNFSFSSKRCLSSSCFLVDRIRFKYRFKISELRHIFASFRENIPKMSLKSKFKAIIQDFAIEKLDIVIVLAVQTKATGWVYIS